MEQLDGITYGNCEARWFHVVISWEGEHSPPSPIQTPRPGQAFSESFGNGGTFMRTKSFRIRENSLASGG
jgi:hypothetical protein